MIDVNLIHERRVNRQARDTSKCTIDRIWLSNKFLKLALTQKYTCPIPAALSSSSVRCPHCEVAFHLTFSVPARGSKMSLRRRVAPPRELRSISGDQRNDQAAGRNEVHCITLSALWKADFFHLLMFSIFH